MKPDLVLEPVGTQIELTCNATQGFRTVWIIILPGETIDLAIATDLQRLRMFLAARYGINTEASTAENPQPPLRIDGTAANNGTIVMCEAFNPSRVRERCTSMPVTMVLYGKLKTYIAIMSLYSLGLPSAPENLTVSCLGGHPPSEGG